ncbi:MAG: prepilin-type N-terminal cleavage/methylation domain-containing protein [Candidatus Tectomicrobia bacterium]|uniref:Prepilin-type N-terminal cleavage/methylation domain-containing protein n=1 Tax=Tectimicrobiota bacterium TaxID=2528274 RepID=A0A932FUK3_UNCTE|nr:prepilin-type N-terminal cleavage/methylation domain-containing protein [Candidatus Tectomicrobia bacterium]
MRWTSKSGAGNLKFPISNFQFPILAQRAGFSLLEVLVALVILGMTMVGVFGLFSGGLRAARLVKEYTQATIHARQKLEELLLSSDLSPNVSSGTFEDSDYRWETRIAPYTGKGWPKKDSELPQLFQIRVRVTWPGPKQDRSYELVTLKMIPREEDELGSAPGGPGQGSKPGSGLGTGATPRRDGNPFGPGRGGGFPTGRENRGGGSSGLGLGGGGRR